MTDKALLRHIIVASGRNLTLVLIPGLLAAGLAGYGMERIWGGTAGLLGGLFC